MATITTINGSDPINTSRSTINTNFSNLNTDLVAAEADIDDVEADISTAQSDITAVEGDVAALESDLDDVEADVATLQAAPTPASGIAIGSTSGPTTTSASDATIPQMTLTVTTHGGNLKAEFCGSFSHSDVTKTSNINFKLDSDAKVGELSYVQNVAGAQVIISAQYLFTGLAGGSHTVVVQWNTNGATFTATGTQRQLILTEIL